MNVKNLWLTVAAPGAGKTTYLTKNAIFGSVIVSRDVIRFNILEPGDDYFSKENEVFDKYVASIQNAFNHTDNVYADATHLTEKSRNKLLDRLDLTNVKVHALYFLTSLDTCIERNSRRSGRAQVPESVIRRMYFQITDPKYDKKYDIKVHYIKEEET